MTDRPPHYTTRELSRETWSDFERFFRKPGEWSSCQCMWFHREGPRPEDELRLTSKERNEKNFQNQLKLVKEGRSHGILVYSGGDPIGWCQYGLKEEFPRIDNSAKYRSIPPPERNERLWRITCFCVDKKFRRSGAAVVGLRGAMESIKRKGRGIVEAYPTTSKAGSALHRGSASMFEKEGFRFVVPLGPHNKVVRKPV